MDTRNGLMDRGSAYRRLIAALRSTCAVLGLSETDAKRLEGAVRLALVILESGREEEIVGCPGQLTFSL